MGDQIAWCVELAVLPGQLDSFIKLTADMVNETAQESGVLSYQRFVSADGQIVHVVERYETAKPPLGIAEHSRTSSPHASQAW